MFKDYYKILGLLPQATQKEILTAYRAMAIKWHPDKNIGQNTTTQMKLLSEAYGVLKNLQKRKAYNIEDYKFYLAKINLQPQANSAPPIVRCYYCKKTLLMNEIEYAD